MPTGKSHISNRSCLEKASMTEISSPNQCLARKGRTQIGVGKHGNDYIAYFLRQKSQLFPIIIIKLLDNFWGWLYLFPAYRGSRY